MQLHLSSWPEIDRYLETSKAILIPIGSTEQHGPNGLLGTDALCPEIIAKRAGDESGILIGPTFNVGQAQHHMAFSGTITLRPSTMIAAMMDWAQSLTRHGFERLYWFNGHGGNINTINAAFSEMYHGITFDRAGSNHSPLRCTVLRCVGTKPQCSKKPSAVSLASAESRFAPRPVASFSSASTSSAATPRRVAPGWT